MDIQERLSAAWPHRRVAARRDLDETAELLRRPAATGELELGESGDVCQAIIDHAKKVDADFIVMGKRGKSSIHDATGSVFTRVVHQAPCSVWVGRV